MLRRQLSGAIIRSKPQPKVIFGLRGYARYFTEDHEWIDVEGGIGTFGITDYAQKEVGDVVYVTIPQVGDNVSKGDAIASIESVKAVSDIYAPVSGEIVEANEKLDDEPALINKESESGAWLGKIKLSSEEELSELMSASKYADFTKS